MFLLLMSDAGDMVSSVGCERCARDWMAADAAAYKRLDVAV